MTVRASRHLTLLFAVLLAGWVLSLFGQQDADKRVINITARMFEYSPSHIVIKKGEAVILALTSLDRLHGFYIPEFDLRADVLPGRSVMIEIFPAKAGRYPFLCDIFCGDRHDEMNGMIVVTE